MAYNAATRNHISPTEYPPIFWKIYTEVRKQQGKTETAGLKKKKKKGKEKLIIKQRQLPNYSF